MFAAIVLRPFATAVLALAATACSASPASIAATDPRSPLILQRMIPLPDTRGRIDHLAIDVAGRRLFVAEVANGSVDIVDLESARVVRRITGLSEPQGTAWLPQRGELAIACGDGTVRFYGGPEQRELARITLGDDADDLRVDERNGQLVAGYGSGGLATIDPVSHRVTGRITFRGHPEGFQLVGGRAFVNVPDDGAVISLDRDNGKPIARWSTGAHRLNFPMALDPGGTIVIAYRLPAALAWIDATTGKTTASQSICGDADDLFLAGNRVLVVCGAGHVDMVRDGRIEARVETGGGARTGLFVPELGSLFVAVPARAQPAAIWELKLADPQ